MQDYTLLNTYMPIVRNTFFIQSIYCDNKKKLNVISVWVLRLSWWCFKSRSSGLWCSILLW